MKPWFIGGYIIGAIVGFMFTSSHGSLVAFTMGFLVVGPIAGVVGTMIRRVWSALWELVADMRHSHQHHRRLGLHRDPADLGVSSVAFVQRV